jgi:hypothetical protein
MRRRRHGPILCVIALCFVLNPLAAASPPDPTWIPGLYDAADFDDVVIQIGLLASACDNCAAPSLAVDSLVHPLILPGRQPLACRSQPPKQSRAPPLVSPRPSSLPPAAFPSAGRG